MDFEKLEEINKLAYAIETQEINLDNLKRFIDDLYKTPTDGVVRVISRNGDGVPLGATDIIPLIHARIGELEVEIEELKEKFKAI